MKLITNSAEIKVTENEDGSKSFQGIGSEVGVENRNGIILTPNCIEFARERYPLLYEHGAGSSEVIGDAKVYYDLASNKYLTDFTGRIALIQSISCLFLFTASAICIIGRNGKRPGCE